MGHLSYYLLIAQVEDYNVMINGRHVKTFEKLQLVKEMITQMVVC